MSVPHFVMLSVTDMARPDQVVFAQLYMCAIGDGRVAAAPMPRQRETYILIDHVHHRRLQLVDIDVLGIDPTQRLRRSYFGGMPGGLIGTKIATVAENREEIAPACGS